MTRKLRILYYNWADPLDPDRRGGGVSVYQRNLIETFSEHTSIEASFLSAGLVRTPSKRTGWRAVRTSGPSRRYELVNSDPLAPGHHSFGHPTQLSSPETRAAFAAVLQDTGPYDVVHFNSLEGLPADILTLRAEFPATRFVVALHNYFAFCPQVNLWQNEARNCTDDAGGSKCATCLVAQTDPRLVSASYLVDEVLGRVGLSRRSPWVGLPIRAASSAARRLLRFRRARQRGQQNQPPKSADPGLIFRERRRLICEGLNHYADSVLCVSQRVESIALRYGVRPEKLSLSYIGTKDAALYERRPIPALIGGRPKLRLAYLGYMRWDKGFFFLLDALEMLPAEILERLDLVIAAGRSDATTLERLRSLGARCAGFEYHDGYRRETLDEILSGVDLGVVPVLWEDNLPQVAIEMHARRIPLLTSDRGGAQELGNSPDMVFEAEDTESFKDRLAAVLNGKIDASTYWSGARAPVTLPEHGAALEALYRGLVTAEAPAPAQSFSRVG